MDGTNVPAAASSQPAKHGGTDEIVPYEAAMVRDPRLALSEGSLFFEGQGKVQEAFRNITARLREIGVDYAVVGGMALLQHGYRRYTEDVDLLVTNEGLKRIHAELVGLGYVRAFKNSKTLEMPHWASRLNSCSPEDIPVTANQSPYPSLTQSTPVSSLTEFVTSTWKSSLS